MKAFVAYRSSGIDRQELLLFLTKLNQSFQRTGVNPYITDLDDRSLGTQASKILTAFDRISRSDIFICIIRKGDTSEGVLLEAGYAYKKLPIILFVQAGIESKVADMADKSIPWLTEDDLFHKISQYSFQ